MIELKTENTGVSTEKHASKLPEYLERIKNGKNGFCKILEDTETIKKINDFAHKVADRYENIVVLGIGGSALGTTCLKQALTHSFHGGSCNCVKVRGGNDFPKSPSGKQSEPHVASVPCNPPLAGEKGAALRAQGKLHPPPALFVIDNIDPTLIKELEDVIRLEKTLFIVISKSGTTPETMSQYEYFRQKTDKSELSAKEHFVFITDPKKGTLREIAEKENITSFDIPEDVGGRFSVLTAVGLLPAKLIGINIEELIEGAKEMNKKFLGEIAKKNLPFQLAATQYSMEREGKNIHVLMPYSQKLTGFADWYKQLLAESIGKKRDNEGKTVHTGITPVNAIGATDQHSQLQLYAEGPDDKLIMFMEVKNLGAKIKIPNTLGNFGENLSFNTLIQAEKEATEESLTKNNRPNLTIKIDSVNERALGELFILCEGATAFLGEFYNINAFDQPGVELSKKLTKEKIHGNPKT